MECRLWEKNITISGSGVRGCADLTNFGNEWEQRLNAKGTVHKPCTLVGKVIFHGGMS